MLTESQIEHSRRVHESVAQLIDRNGGWLSFERYMDWALYAPGLGYYSAGAHKLGPGGDFTTAPELSALFGGCMARQCAAVFAALSPGDSPASETDAIILEVGAGSGQLAVDVLSRLQQLARLPSRYCILDISADLRERQRRRLEAALPHLMHRIAWLDAPPRSPFRGVVIANEVLDALPVARFRWHAERCEEMGVAHVAGALAWSPRPASDALDHQCRQLAAAAHPAWQDGYESEYCPRLASWSRDVVHALESGIVLWSDYGLPRAQYYMAERNEGTLLCHFEHRAHADPFFAPGLQDITAWVDFTALAEATRGTGFTVAGFTTQAHFLAGLGIDREMQALADGDARRYAALAQQARTLLLPGEMGERFKVMAWRRGLDTELAGFALHDLRHTL